MTDKNQSQSNTPNGYNIIDIIKGIHALQLYIRIPNSAFTFFIGLICKANELGFKEEISLTTQQAMALGGGNSRQTVNNNRKILSNTKIDKQALLKVQHGSNIKNYAAKYKINYEILVKYGTLWTLENNGVGDIASNEIDGRYTQGIRKPDASLTFHRSEESIVEKNKEESEASEHSVDSLPTEEDAVLPNIYVTVRRKILIKYPEMKLSDGDVGEIIAKSKEPFYEGGKIDYWYHIIDKMPEWDKLEIQNVHGILAYGKRAWPDYKKAHKIQAFFGR